MANDKMCPGHFGFVKISGKIKNYRQNREEVSFVLTRNDRRSMGIVSAALAAAGAGGQAIATAENASHFKEEADYVRFDIDDRKFEGWLWRSPFKEGDDVQLVAVPQDNHCEIVGMLKPSDRLIALYPHCVRGKTAFFSLAMKWWFILGFIANTILVTSFIGIVSGRHKLFGEDFWAIWGGMLIFFTFLIAMLMRQWFPFVRTAQRVFKEFGWKNASSIDLVKTTRLQRKPDDPPELGVYYFGY